MSLFVDIRLTEGLLYRRSPTLMPTMKLASTARLILSNLGRHKRRSLFASLGIALGVAALIFLVGLGQGVRREVIDGILARLPLNELVVKPKQGIIREQLLLDDEAVELFTEHAGVEAAYPAMIAAFPSSLRGVSVGWLSLPRFYTDMGTHGWDSAMIELAAADYSQVELLPGEIPVILSPVLLDFYNRAFAPANNLRGFTEEQVIGASLGLILGRSSMQHNSFIERTGRVVGFSPKAIEMGVTVPLDEVRHAARISLGSEPSGYDMLYVVCEDTPSAAELGNYAVELGFTTETSHEAVNKASLTIDVVTFVLSMVGVTILLIASFSIFNNFTLIVAERRTEIGLLRCLGCTRRDIRSLIIGEAGVIGFVNGIVGVLLGVGASLLANNLLGDVLPDFSFKPEQFFYLPWWLLGGGVFLALGVAVLAAWLPANQAAKLPPAKALSAR